MFSSPTGVLYFKMKLAVVVGIVVMLFSSPTGVLYFKMLIEDYTRRFYYRVFVPYWGSLFQNRLNKELNTLWTKVFSSPTGVLYFKIEQWLGLQGGYE